MRIIIGFFLFSDNIYFFVAEQKNIIFDKLNHKLKKERKKKQEL